MDKTLTLLKEAGKALDLAIGDIEARGYRVNAEEAKLISEMRVIIKEIRDLFIQASPLSAAVLAEVFEISEARVYQLRHKKHSH